MGNNNNKITQDKRLTFLGKIINKKSITQQQLNRLYNSYDQNRKGSLSKTEVKIYIEEFLSASKLKDLFSGHIEKKKISYDDFVQRIYEYMDKGNNGIVSFSQLKQPNKEEWKNFLDKILKDWETKKNEDKKKSSQNSSIRKAQKNTVTSDDVKADFVHISSDTGSSKSVSKSISEKSNKSTSEDPEKSSSQTDNLSEKSSLSQPEKIEEPIKDVKVPVGKKEPVKSKSKSKSENTTEEFSEPQEDVQDYSQPENNSEEQYEFSDYEAADFDYPVENEDNYDDRRGLLSMSRNAILDYQQNIVDKVTTTLNIDKTIARLLLNACKWNSDTVLSRYFEDKKNLYRDAGLKIKTKKKEKVPKPTGIFECLICLDEVKEYIRISACGHYFCKECWKGDLSVKITEGKIFELTCMAQGCDEIVPDKTVKKVVDTETWEKYQQFLSAKFVDMSDELRWCIAPGCGKVVGKASYEGRCQVGKCICGCVFCWDSKCRALAHSPSNCEQYKTWQETTASGDFLDNKWVLDNTKKCTKCGNRIEKTGGCFQMTCRCRHQFCWLCGQDWTTHANHFQCTKHPEAGRPEDVGNKVLYLQNVKWDNDELKVKLVDRFNHFENAQKLSKQKAESFQNLINILMEKGTLLNAKPFFTAQAQLDEIRRVLKGMIIVRSALIGSDKENIKAAQAESLESLHTKLQEKFEVESQTLCGADTTFQTVQKYISDLNNLTSIAHKTVINVMDGFATDD